MVVENQMVGVKEMPCMADYYHNRFAGKVTTDGLCDLKALSMELGGHAVWRSFGN
jgi:hypothetical protein